MAWLIYTLCAVAAAVCSGLLFLSFRRTGYRLLFWSALCFAGLTLNNLLLVLDKLVFPDSDLSVVRSAVALIAMSILLYGFVWDTE